MTRAFIATVASVAAAGGCLGQSCPDLVHGPGWPAIDPGGATTPAVRDLLYEPTSGLLYGATDAGMILGGVPVAGVGSWTDAGGWVNYGAGLDGDGRTLARMSVDGRPGLAIGGAFTRAGGLVSPNVTVLTDDGDWVSLRGTGGPVTALAVTGEGATQTLWMAGEFDGAAGVSAAGVVRWTYPDRWEAASLPRSRPSEIVPQTLATFDDGNGEAVYVGLDDHFETGSTVLRWNGTAWEPVGDLQGNCWTLEVIDVGDGPQLIAGGDLGGWTLAAWDGTAWQRLADRDDGTGEIFGVAALRIGADDYGLAATSGRGLWRISGASVVQVWSIPSLPVEAVPNGVAVGLPYLHRGCSVDLAVSGAAIYGCRTLCPADLDDDGALTLFDFLEFQNRFALGDPVANCDDNCSLDLFDFLCFQNAFAQGCE